MGNRTKVEYKLDDEWVLNEDLCSYCCRDENSTQFLYQANGDTVCEDESCVYQYMQNYCDDVFDIVTLKTRESRLLVSDLRIGDLVRFKKDYYYSFLDDFVLDNFAGLVDVNKEHLANDTLVIKFAQYTSGDKRGERESFSLISSKKFIESAKNMGIDEEDFEDNIQPTIDGFSCLYLDSVFEDSFEFKLLEENYPLK